MFKMMKTTVIAMALIGGLSVQAEAQNSRHAGGNNFVVQQSQGFNNARVVNQRSFNNRGFNRGFNNRGFNRGFSNRGFNRGFSNRGFNRGFSNRGFNRGFSNR